jgi:hypothetical protein
MALPPNDYVRSNIPIPDPSEITSREIAKLRDEMQKQFSTSLNAAIEYSAAKRETLTSAITALDARLTVVITGAETATEYSSERFNDKLHALSVLTDERFEGLKIAFREDKIAAATAVAAAFAAQEKLSVAQNLSNTAAITKSEGSTTKELESLDEKIGTLKESVASDIRNLEGRLNRGEGGAAGMRETRSEHRADIGQIMLALGLGLSLLLGLANLLHFPAPVVTAAAVVPVGPR